ncbi:sporulation histidine kinase inhibitor Sda [Brevibacillus humidisoli]|uniref:sporulation histidine kinase inhibitor Sda n=1 Tax=Brevibacillus humidisoli TaxID=2895522 RepID=UPI001E3AAF30|nr:sporulation histidine kinase inhibitor Sda [Brevibacillus humidisoli]UFJ42971.1 sporulation histidine kinase inhibitor Sda [Brevibacillus humidisoli]
MRYVSDSLLLEVYERAVSLQLEPAFIELLSNEIERRNLQRRQASTHDPATRPA